MINKPLENNLSVLIENEYLTLANQYRKHFDQSVFNANYLLTGPSNIGKKYLAKLFAKLLVCDDYSIQCSCMHCLKINNENHSDVLHIDTNSECDLTDAIHLNHQKDSSRSIKICQIKRLNRISMLSPTYAKFKIFVINNINLMTTEAANAMLKTLEDAPASTFFLLISSDIDGVIDTVKSRCQIIHIMPLDFKRLTGILSKNYGIDTLKANDMAILSRSRINNASMLISHEENYAIFEQSIVDLQKLLQSEAIDRMNFAERLNGTYKKNPDVFYKLIGYWEDWFRWHLYSEIDVNVAPSFFSS